MKLVCNKCKYPIATVIGDVKLPLIGAMFTSKDEKHGFPPPWSPVVTELHMNCPMCQLRPFEIDGDTRTILTEEGEVVITTDGVKEEQPVINHPAVAQTFPVEGKHEEEVRQEGVGDDGMVGESVEKDEEKDAEEKDDITMNFNEMLATGEIIQRGSWFEYAGKNFRKDKLMGVING